MTEVKCVAVVANDLIQNGEPEMGRTSPLLALSSLPDDFKVVSVGGDYSELKGRGRRRDAEEGINTFRLQWEWANTDRNFT